MTYESISQGFHRHMYQLISMQIDVYDYIFPPLLDSPFSLTENSYSELRSLQIFHPQWSFLYFRTLHNPEAPLEDFIVRSLILCLLFT